MNPKLIEKFEELLVQKHDELHRCTEVGENIGGMTMNSWKDWTKFLENNEIGFWP